MDLVLHPALQSALPLALPAAAGLLVGLGIAAVALLAARARRPAAAAAEQRIVELGARVQAMGELLHQAQAQLQNAVNARLDGVTRNLQSSLDANKKDTFENLDRLNQRLALIDRAQNNLAELTSQVTSLRDVLANKQARGAFGQGRMEAIIQDALPKGHYEFQPTLRNGKRPDCVVYLPDQRPLVIDAKFPLEAVAALRDAASEDERKRAAARVRADVMKHVTDIADKYLIAGETQDIALMFVPSESVYAELHEGFDDVVQKAHRLQVMLVSPTLLMLAVQVIQQVQKDARMREAADSIRAEVGAMTKDVRLLGERLRKLQSHFSQSNEDVRQALISVEKIEKRSDRIREVDFESADAPAGNVIAAPVFKLESGSA